MSLWQPVTLPHSLPHTHTHTLTCKSLPRLGLQLQLNLQQPQLDQDRNYGTSHCKLCQQEVPSDAAELEAVLCSELGSLSPSRSISVSLYRFPPHPGSRLFLIIRTLQFRKNVALEII